MRGSSPPCHFSGLSECGSGMDLYKAEDELASLTRTRGSAPGWAPEASPGSSERPAPPDFQQVHHHDVDTALATGPACCPPSSVLDQQDRLVYQRVTQDSSVSLCASTV